LTVEEALVALLALVAGILLFLGLAQALDARPPRHARPRRGDDDGRRSRAPGATSALSGVNWARPAERPPERAEAGDGGDEARAAPPVAPAPAAFESTPPPEPASMDPSTVESPEPGHHPAISAPALQEMALVEACATLFLAGKHAEMLVAVASSLGRAEGADSIRSAHAATAVGSLASLSRRALGDEAEARSALATALRDLPEPVVEGCPPRLAALSVPIGRRFLEASEQSPEGAEERIAVARLAAFWLSWRLVAAPADHGAQALLETARAALAAGCAEVIAGLIRRQEWIEAHELIKRGRETGELPAARGDELVELLATSLKHEIERLTAPIIRGAKNESRAVAGLEQAETVLLSLADTSLPPRSRTSMIRRLWRGYATLGVRRLKAGSLDAAADALVRALGMKEIGRRRQRHVKEALVRTLEAMGDQTMDTVAKLLADENREAASEQVKHLDACLERARGSGLSREQLSVASAKVRVLVQRLEAPPTP
jgi:hypothetical protein